MDQLALPVSYAYVCMYVCIYVYNKGNVPNLNEILADVKTDQLVLPVSYIYVYIYMYKFIYMYIYIYICTHTHIRTNIYICIFYIAVYI